MTYQELEILKNAQRPEGARFDYTTSLYHSAMDLSNKGFLRRLPTGRDIGGRRFKTTRLGKQALKANLSGREIKT